MYVEDGKVLAAFVTTRKNRQLLKISRLLVALLPSVANALEQFPSAAQNVVQRFLKMRRRLSQFAPYLFDVFLIALLDLFTK